MSGRAKIEDIVDGEFKLNSPSRNGGYGNCLSNFQFNNPPYEIEWEADLGKD